MIELSYKSDKYFNYPETLRGSKINVIKRYSIDKISIEEALEDFKKEIIRIENFQENKR